MINFKITDGGITNMGFFDSIAKSIQNSGDKKIEGAIRSLSHKSSGDLLRIANADYEEYDGITRQAARYLYARSHRGSFEFENGKKDAMTGISEKYSVRQFL